MRWTRLVPLGLPALLLGGWLVWLHARYGYWPSDADHLPRVAPPLVGLWQGRAGMGAVGWLSSLLALALVGLAVRRDPRSLLVWCTWAFAGVALFAGAHVWALESFRAFLPLYAFALLGALPWGTRAVASA